MPKFSLMPKETKYFAFFQQEAENIVKMAQQLKDMINTCQNVKERNSVLTDLKKDGNAITHNVMKLLHKSFITPIDKEDITSVARSLDDIAGGIHSVADTVYLYRIDGPTDRAKEMCCIIVQVVQEVAEGVAGISSRINETDLLKRCVTIHQIENSGDVVYRAALTELFADPNDIRFVVKWREIYKHMELVINACEEFANVLEGIAVKYT
jgi:uncharacterized protein